MGRFIVSSDMPSSAPSSSVSRRSVVKGAAWAVPAIVVAAPVPAFAASPCTPTTALDDLTPGTTPGTITFQPSGVTATLTFSSSTPGGGTGATGEVAATSTTPSWNYIELEMTRRLRQGSYVELTITLSQPVEGLSFTLHDIDEVTGSWYDRVRVYTSGYTYARGDNVIGTGSAGDLFRPRTPGDRPIDSGLGDVRLTWPGAVSSVRVRYVAGADGNSQNQHIGLGDLSYQACILPNGTAQPGGVLPQQRTLGVQPGVRRLSTGTPKFVTSDGTADL